MQDNKIKYPIFSIIFLCSISVLILFSIFLIKESPNHINLSNTYIVPCKKYIFGTDSMGRNILIRTIYGGKTSILIGIISMINSSVIGIIYGCVSGYFGGYVDKVMTRILEMFLTVPTIILAAFIQSFFQTRGLLEIILLISFTGWMKIGRIVRGEVIKLKQMDFVLASKNMGGGFIHISLKHFVPNFVPAIIYICTLNVAYGIMTESTLSFLGLGLPANIPSWGSMLIDAQKDILSNKWWTSIFPGIFIVFTVFSVTNIGEYIRKRNNKRFTNI
ncbi:ABC transporter permease [Haloimpatiens sp. FM7330]|uniref:ABC transporter permease n=1 Tax=Haloimpatiens sp. FM7330 TaxID=3298610 RepID=UPI00363ADFF3